MSKKVPHALHQLVHGYAHGHTLLTGSLDLSARDLDLAARLSDLSGTLTSEGDFYPYLTLYPLPSGLFYAVARTWLDPSAGRSGCVLTHTLLVPMTVWAQLEQPAVLAARLCLPQRDNLAAYSRPLDWPTGRIDPDSGTPQLGTAFVRRYFVEGISPLVWLGEMTPDSIAWRIIALLWPSLRSRFSCCTLAFQQRYQDDRPFDLLFAPFRAVSRFADLPREHMLDGQSVSPTDVQDDPDWIDSLTRLVFDPSEGSARRFRSLAARLEPEPTAVGKVLFFESLAHRANSSPTAALGALDILEQLGPVPAQCVEEKLELAEIALSLALRLPAEERLEVLFLLCDRLDRPAMADARLSGRAIDNVSTSVPQAPRKALELGVRLLDHRVTRTESTYLAGLASGCRTLAQARPDALLLFADYPAAAFRLFTWEPSLAATLLRTAHHGGDHRAAELLLPWLQQLDDEETRRSARLHVLPALRNSGEAGLLDELLRDVASSEVASACSILLSGTPDHDQASLGVLRERLGASHAPEILAWARLGDWHSRCAAAVIAAAFKPTGQGLLDILSVDWLDSRKHGLLASAFIEFVSPTFAPHWVAECAAGDTRFWTVLLPYAVEVAAAADLLARVVERMQHSCVARVRGASAWISQLRVSSASGMIQDHAMRQVVQDYIKGNIDAQTSGEWCSISWANSWLQAVSSWTLCSLVGVEVRASAASWQRAWCFVEAAPDALYLNTNQVVEDVIDTLGRVRQWEYADATVLSWIRVIERLAALDHERHLAAASTALNCALSHEDGPFGALVAATFYAVHQAAMLDHAESSRAWHPWRFFQWDKARELRGALVERFFRSKWNPSDLVLATKEPWLLRKIARRVLRKWRGKEYLEQALAAMGTASSSSGALRAELTEILRNPNYFEDWD